MGCPTDEELVWANEVSALVAIWASADLQRIPERWVFQPGHGFHSDSPRLKAPATLLAEGVLPERMWRPFVRTKSQKKKAAQLPF